MRGGRRLEERNICVLMADSSCMWNNTTLLDNHPPIKVKKTKNYPLTSQYLNFSGRLHWGHSSTSNFSPTHVVDFWGLSGWCGISEYSTDWFSVVVLAKCGIFKEVKTSEICHRWSCQWMRVPWGTDLSDLFTIMPSAGVSTLAPSGDSIAIVEWIHETMNWPCQQLLLNSTPFTWSSVSN